MKKLSSLLITFFFIILLLPLAVYAQQGPSYDLLAPLPLSGTNAADPSTTASDYIEGMVKLAVALSGALAVIMLIAAGIEYMSIESITGKSQAKEKIQNALVGLLLVIASFTILSTINPKLLSFTLDITPQEIRGDLDGNLGEDEDPDDPAPTSAPTGEGTPWPSDSVDRANLLNVSGGKIIVNKFNCQKIGDSNCTSVWGIGSVIINELEALQRACNCPITITGGTEYWLHGNQSKDIAANTTAHKPGGGVVDLSVANTALNNHIRNRGTLTTAAGCSTGTKYRLGNGIYVNETSSAAITGAHWHVCYDGGEYDTTSNSRCPDCVQFNGEINITPPTENGCKLPGPCFAHKDLADRLLSLDREIKRPPQSISMHVEKSYPPTMTNVRPCLKDGTCVFIIVSPNTATSANTFLFRAGRADLNATLLTKNADVQKMYVDGGVPSASTSIDPTFGFDAIWLVWRK